MLGSAMRLRDQLRDQLATLMVSYPYRESATRVVMACAGLLTSCVDPPKESAPARPRPPANPRRRRPHGLWRSCLQPQGQAGSVTRTLRLPGRKALEVHDHIRCVAQAGTVRWQLVTRAQVPPPGRRSLRFTQDGRSPHVTVEESATVRLVTTSPQPTLTCTTVVPGLTVVDIETQAAAGADVTYRIRLGQL